MEWTLALVHSATALRPEEAFGLKWEDVDWTRNRIQVRRGWSKGMETNGKTPNSNQPVAMHPTLAQFLPDWRKQSIFPKGFRLDLSFVPLQGEGSAFRFNMRERLSEASGCYGWRH